MEKKKLKKRKALKASQLRHFRRRLKKPGVLKEHGRGDKPSKVKRIRLNALAVARRKFGLSQRATAKLFGVNAGFYCMIESGKRQPGLQLAIKIARHYGYTVEQLWAKRPKSCPHV